MSSPDALRPRRRPTPSVDVGGVLVGSAHPVVVQSMTNTDTADPDGTALQVARLAQAGSQLVRVTVNTEAAAAAVPEMVRKVRDLGVETPIVGDFHYNGHKLLVEYPEAARQLAKYRINPGNVGAKRHDENFQTIVRVAVEHDKPVRIGVNWGSLDQQLLTELMDANARLAEPRDARDVMIEAMLQSALRSAELAEETGLRHDRIIVSAKVSGVRDLVDVYRLLAARCDYPLHLGLTEAGMGDEGDRRQHRGARDPPQRGDRRHHPRLADARARGRPGARGRGRPAGPPVPRAAKLHAPGQRLPGLRPHDLHLLPGDGPRHPRITSRRACPSGARRTPASRT